MRQTPKWHRKAGALQAVASKDLFFTPEKCNRDPIVFSGDTNPVQETIRCLPRLRRADSRGDHTGVVATRPDTFQRFAAKYHTTTAQLAELAQQAKPRLLILYHYSSLSPEELFDDMLARYSGHFVIGRDLDVY